MAFLNRPLVSRHPTRKTPVLLLAWGLLWQQACAGGTEGTREGPPSPSTVVDAGAPTADDAGAACPPENPYCNEPPTGPDDTCGSESIDLNPAGVNLMIAVDGAASMATHWPRIRSSVESFRNSHPDAAVGLHVFWGVLVESIEQGFSKSNWCGNTENRVLDVGPNSAQALLGHLGDAPPGPSFVGGLFETAPVIEPLNYYLTHATKLADPERTNYLLFITNGNDNCFGSVYANKHDKLLAYEKLAVELLKRNIRLIPIGFDASAKPGSTGNFGTTNGNTDLDVLNTLLKFGGSGLSEVPKADDPDKLGEVIAQVGEAVRNCRFQIPAALDPSAGLNPFHLDFVVNGKVVPRDRTEREGWNFVAGDTSQVEMFGNACQAVRADAVLEARKTCRLDEVCGTAAKKVETKQRAVLYLLDASASRIECADGTWGCLVPPNIPPEIFMRTSLTFWETVQHALGKSLVAPINDDIDFGLQFFPGKKDLFLSCNVDPLPEIPPAKGTAIAVLGQMLEKLPFGFSPVVQVLENVAAAPGRLAEPDVEGAVVMLSDGGDNCAGVEQDEIVARLGAAADKLLAQGVKTYVVRFGSAAGRTPEQDAQLRAIVAHGGTALSDPADMSKTPYVDAKSADELNAALASISDTLATCSFSLGEPPEGADKATVNLYINGQIVPFDGQQSGMGGWGWLDEAQSVVELYGEACEEFKTARRTSVVVEFGCEQVVVL